MPISDSVFVRVNRGVPDSDIRSEVSARSWIGLVRDLRGMAWPVASADTRDVLDAVQCFQEGFNLGERLVVDRWPGPVTLAAVAESVRLGGRASPNFFWQETWDYRQRWGRTRRETYAAGEKIRGLRNVPLLGASWYRSERTNELVGGAERSRHLYAEAGDIMARFGARLEAVVGLGAVTGIGVMGWPTLDAIVTHYDVGGLCENGSGVWGRERGVSDPMVWWYDQAGRAQPGRYYSDWF